MVAAGLMSEAEAYADERAHAITGWLGADDYELDPHTASFKPDRPGVAARPQARSIASASDGTMVPRSDQVGIGRADDGRAP